MEGSYSIVVDGESYEVVVRDLGRQASERRFQVTVGDREHEVAVTLETEGQPAPKLNLGSVKNIEAPRPQAKKSGPAAAKAEAPGKVVGAPMTGKIVSIHVVEGQKVVEGDLLVVLEAMKMENSILASAGGVVSGISVGVGDNVRKGEKICALLA